MLIRKGAILFLVCFVQHLIVQGQENYVKGSIVTLAGDTIRGEVDYRNWRINPKAINFRKIGQSAPDTYNPAEIKSFSAAGELYSSGIVETEKSSRVTMNIDENPKFIIDVDTVFLRTLVSGNKSLYQFIDSADRENFYIGTDTNTDFVLLRYKQYLISENGIKQKQIRRLYVGQLANYLSDCKTFRKSAPSIEYSEKSLTNAFHDYYACTSENKIQQEQISERRLDVVGLAGVSHLELNHRTLSASFSPAIGISLNTVFPRNLGRWSLNNTVLYSRYSAKDFYEETSRLGRYSRYDYDVAFSSFKLNALLRYTTYKGKIKYFFNGGPLVGLTVLSKNSVDVYSQFGPDATHERRPAFEKLEVPLGFALGLGSTYNKLSLELRYEKTRGLLSFNSRSLLLLLGYRISK